MKGSPHPQAKQWKVLRPGTFLRHLGKIEQLWALQLTNLDSNPGSLTSKFFLYLSESHLQCEDCVNSDTGQLGKEQKWLAHSRPSMHPSLLLPPNTSFLLTSFSLPLT